MVDADTRGMPEGSVKSPPERMEANRSQRSWVVWN
jgi:hypothetical protein